MQAHIELAQTADGHALRAGYGGGREITHAALAFVRDHVHPVVMTGEHGVNFIERYVLIELDGARLAVTAHGADAHADAVDRNRSVFATEDLIGLGLPLPFLFALTAVELFVDPWDQAAGERRAEEFLGITIGAEVLSDLADDVV